jgi:hypothetical protein
MTGATHLERKARIVVLISGERSHHVYTYFWTVPAPTEY